MIFMKSKKGFFLFGFSLIMFFLMIYAVIVFFGDRPDVDNNAKLGQIVFDVYDANIESDKYLFFIHKVGEYSLLGAMKETMLEGLNDEECMVEGKYILYKDVKCNFYPEKLVSAFSEKVGDNFDKFVTNVSSENYTFETRFNGSSIFLIGNSEIVLDFADEDHFNFTRSINFETYFDYDFLWVDEMRSSLKLNLICLENSKDEQKLENIAGDDSGRDPQDCLREHPQFSEITKKNEVVYFNYSAEGHLFEKVFNIPLAVDLEGFKAAISIK